MGVVAGAVAVSFVRLLSSRLTGDLAASVGNIGRGGFRFVWVRFDSVRFDLFWFASDHCDTIPHDFCFVAVFGAVRSVTVRYRSVQFGMGSLRCRHDKGCRVEEPLTRISHAVAR